MTELGYHPGYLPPGNTFDPAKMSTQDKEFVEKFLRELQWMRRGLIWPSTTGLRPESLLEMWRSRLESLSRFVGVPYCPPPPPPMGVG